MLVKGIVGGVIATILMRCIILSFHVWQVNAAARQQGFTAWGDGWRMDLSSPFTIGPCPVDCGFRLGTLCHDALISPDTI
jgi:hypothetical protein